MGKYPEEAAGWKGQETSREAAELQNKKLKNVRALILSEFDHGPGNPEAIWDRLKKRGCDLWFMSVRCRVSDLGKLGHLVDTGERERSMSGRAKSIVWRKAEPHELEAFQAAKEAADA